MGSSRGPSSRGVLRAACRAVLLLAVLKPAWCGTAADLFDAAERAFGQALYPAAAESLRALLRDFPDDPLTDEADYLLAMCRIYSGSYADAATALEQYPRRYPASPNLRAVSYWLGYSRYQLGQSSQAIAAFRAQIQSYPAEIRYRQYSLSYLAELYDRSGNTAAALQACDELIASGAGGELAAHALFRSGSIRLKLKDYPRAQAAFARVRLELGTSALATEALYFEGEALVARGEREEASRRYQAFIDAAAAPGGPKALLEQAYLKLARMEAESGDADRALELSLRLESEFPASALLPEALALRAEMLFDRGDLRQARTAYAAALQRIRDPAVRQKLQFDMALCAAGLGEPAAALAGLEEAARGPDALLAAKSRYRQAVIQAAQGAPERAIPILQGLVSGQRADEETLRFLGELLDDAPRAREAREVWSQLVSRFPLSTYRPRYLYRRASAALALQDHAGALEDFNALIRDFGNERGSSELVAEAHYNVGFVYSSRGEYVRSLPFFAKALSLSRDADLRSRCLYAQGVAAYNTEDFSTAIGSFTAYIAQSEEGAARGRGLLSLGKAKLRTDDAAGAADALDRAASELDGSEEGAEGLYWLGVARSRLGQNAAAGEAFLRIATRYPKSARAPEALLRAGVAARLSGDLAGSRARLEEALSRLGGANRSATREESLYELGITLLAQGNVAGARGSFADLVRLFPSSSLAAEGYLRIAQASYQAARYRDAAAEFSAVARDYGKSDAAATAAFWAAESALRAGDSERAATGYWDYLRRYPGSSYALAAESGVAQIVADSKDASFLRRLYDAAESDTGVPPELANRVRLEYALFLYSGGSYRDADSVARRVDPQELSEPHRGEAQLLAARLQRRLGRPGNAIDALSAISGSRTDRVGAEALLELGETLLDQGRAQDGVAELLKLTVLYAQQKDLVPRALSDAMAALKGSGDSDGAAKLAKRLQSEFPDYRAER